MARGGTTTITLKANRLPELARRFPAAVSAVLRAGALATEAGAKSRAPVDTGFLRASVRTEGATPGSLSMRVAVGADYGAHVHEGTRRMPPRPFLRETTEQTFPDLENDLRGLEKAL